MEEAINGVTLKMAAEINAKHTTLQTQWGDREVRQHFVQYLMGRGLDEATWVNSWNAWFARMNSDPTGQVQAQYAMAQQQAMMAAHMADVPAAQDLEGVSLDTYAKIMAKIAAGEDANAILAAEGLPMDQWQRAQTAWNGAMASDMNITMQYGQLYAQHSPGHQERMQAQIAAQAAADHAMSQNPSMEEDEPEVEYTLDNMLEELRGNIPAKRWQAAHYIYNEWDRGDQSDAKLVQAAKDAVVAMIECLERHDKDTASNAESAGRDLIDMGRQGFLENPDEARSAIGRCLNRAKDDLETFKLAFEPIRDKATPERIYLRSNIDDYTSLVEELTDFLNDWDDDVVPAGAASSDSDDDEVAFEDAPTMVASPSMRPNAAQPSNAIQSANAETGILFILKRLPVIGNILRILGL